MEEIEIIKRMILQKLVRANIWGGKHTPIDFIIRSVPEHYRNTHKGKKVIDNALKELINHEWIILVLKRTGKGSEEHLSLNPRKIGEIRQFIEKTSV